MGSSPRKLLIKLQKQHGKDRQHADTYAFVIAGKNLKLKSSANGSVYRICDIVEKLPETIDCNGFQWPVTCVLKLYARIPQKSLKQQREKRRYDLLLRGKPTLTDA